MTCVWMDCMAESTTAQTSSPLIIITNAKSSYAMAMSEQLLPIICFFLISLMSPLCCWMAGSHSSFQRFAPNERLWCKNCNANRDWIADMFNATSQALLSWLRGSHYCPSSPSSTLPNFLEAASLYYWMAGCHSFFLPSFLPACQWA